MQPPTSADKERKLSMSGSGSIIKAAPASISPRTISPQSSPRGRLSPQKSAPAPEQPSERPISEALRPLERRGQASEGGGWGWGSMWSSVSSYVAPAMANASDMINTFIEGDTDAPSGESREPLRQEAAAEAKAEAGPAVDGTPTTPVPQHQIGKEPIEVLDDEGSDVDDDPFTKAIGSGLSAVSDTASYLGSVLSAAATDKDVLDTNKIVQSELVKGSVEAGKDIAHTGLNILENIGQEALKLLTVTTGNPQNPRMRPIFVPENLDPRPEGNVPLVKVNTAEVTFHSLFDEYAGSKCLEQLERLGIESLTKFSQSQKKLSSQQSTLYNNELATLQATLLAEPEELAPEATEALVKQIVVARAEQIAKLGAALKTEPLLPLQESLTIIACAFQQLRVDSMPFLAKLTASATEVLLRKTRILLEEAEKAPIATGILQSRARENQQQAAVYSAALTRASNLYSECIKEISALSIAFLEKNFIEKNKEEVEKELKNIKSVSELDAHNIFLDASAGVSSVADAVKYLLPVYKYLLAVSIIGSSAATVTPAPTPAPAPAPATTAPAVASTTPSKPPPAPSSTPAPKQ